MVLDIVKKPNRLYPKIKKEKHEGYSIYSNHFTEDKRKKIYEFIKYRLK